MQFFVDNADIEYMLIKHYLKYLTIKESGEMMNITQKTFQLICFTTLCSGLVSTGAIAAQYQGNEFTLSPEFSMDSGDYGGGDTISTYSMSITGEYSFAPRWTVSLTVVPYQYQDETYTDVVLIRGQPVHHADATGGSSHHVDTHVSHPGDVHHADPLPSVPHPDDHVSLPAQPDPHVQHPSQPQPAPQVPNPSHPAPHAATASSLGASRPMASQPAAATSGVSQPQASSGTAAASPATSSAQPAAQQQVVEQQVRRHGSESGVGDAFVDVSYALFDENEAMPGVSLHAGVKLPTADEDKGLGTGELDYQVGVGAGKLIDRWYLSGGLDYNILGDPDEYELDNYVSGYASVATEVTDNLEVSMQLSAAQAATDFSDDSLDLGIGTSYYLEKYGTVSAGMQKGLTDGSPDYTFRVGYSISF